MIAPTSIAHPYDTSSTNNTSGTNNGNTPTASKELGPDSFITLLTAQLQAQDPTNPMDPNQMVDELTNMNTLQETIQVREDLDALLSASGIAVPGASGSASSSSNSQNASATSAYSASSLLPGMS